MRLTARKLLNRGLLATATKETLCLDRSVTGLGGRVVFGRSGWRQDSIPGTHASRGKAPTCLFRVKSSNNDQNPIGHHKCQKRSGRGLSRMACPQPSWGWHLVNSNFSLPHSTEGGLGKGPAHGACRSHRAEAHVALLLLPKEEKCHFLSSASP